MTLKYSSACCRVGPSAKPSALVRSVPTSCFGCSLATSSCEADGHLEGIVDPPLETSEGTDHEDSGAKTLPETVEADIGIDLSNGATLLVHDGDHGIGGMRDNSAEDTSPVTGKEGDHELSGLGVRALGGGEDVLVEGLDGVLESTELHHGVGNLTEPQRLDALVEAVPALSVHDLRPALASSSRESASVAGLHAHLQLHIRKNKGGQLSKVQSMNLS